MRAMSGKLQLIEREWYAWQMLPGYARDHVPYLSPIQVLGVTPRKTGDRTLKLSIWNALYAEGVRYVDLTLRIVKHTDSHLIADILQESGTHRSAVITPISFEWLARFFPRTDLPAQEKWADLTVSRFLETTFANAD